MNTAEYINYVIRAANRYKLTTKERATIKASDLCLVTYTGVAIPLCLIVDAGIVYDIAAALRQRGELVGRWDEYGD